METPTPFNLNEAIRRWQQNLGTSPAFKADNLEELASHLRASVQNLKADGLSEEEAFQIATQRLGERGALEREFAKVTPSATWSLPVLLFWIVAGIYLFQVAFSLVCGILGLRQMLEWRDFVRLIAAHAPIGQIYQTFSSRKYLGHLGLYGVFMLSIVAGLVFILGARLAKGNWKGVGASIGSFARPIRTALGLVVPGLVVTLLPAFVLHCNTAWKIRVAATYHDGYAVAQAAVNISLVLIMVLLARRGLCKVSPAGGTRHNCATKNARL